MGKDSRIGSLEVEMDAKEILLNLVFMVCLDTVYITKIEKLLL